MDGKQRVVIEALLIMALIISIMLIFFPSEVPTRRLPFLYINSPLFPYARVLFPIFTVLLYILRKKHKGELTIEQKMALWSDKKQDK